jgi:GNAT superfamily N-acetyltransferase
MEWSRPPYRISDRPEDQDVDAVHAFLTSSYWARGIPRETVLRSIRHALPFGLFNERRQIGFARAVTDRATFAYLADVFVTDEERGRGLGAWLVETVLGHPELYRRFGFAALEDPTIIMTIHDPGIYTR